MTWRLMVCCVSGLLLADAAAAQTPAKSTAAPSQLSSPSAQPTTSEAANAVPRFPSDYRRRIAVLLMKDYVRDGKGPPQISDPKEMRSIYGTVGAVRVCVRFLVEGTGLFGAAQPKADRDYSFVIRRGELRLRAYKYKWHKSCEEPGAMRPFMELERAARQLKDCHARGATDCRIRF